MKNSDMPPSDSEMAKWEAEFNQLSQGNDEDYDYDKMMREVWENSAAESEPTVRFDEEGIPVLSAYSFGWYYDFVLRFPDLTASLEQSNPYLDPSASAQNPLQDAKDLLARNGSLTEAALLLEAAIQKWDLGIGGYEAWILLGETRNMDEREEAGLRALAEGVRIAEEVGATGEGMIVRFRLWLPPAMLMILRSRSRYPTPTRATNALRTLCFSVGCVLASPMPACRLKPSTRSNKVHGTPMHW